MTCDQVKSLLDEHPRRVWSKAEISALHRHTSGCLDCLKLSFATVVRNRRYLAYSNGDGARRVDEALADPEA